MADSTQDAKSNLAKDAKTEADTDKDDLTSDELKQAIEKAGLVKSFDKHVSSEIDRRVTQAIKTHDEKLRAEQDKAKQDKEKAEKEKSMSESEKKISTLEESINKLTGMLTGLAEAQTKSKREDLVKDALKKADLPENFAKFITADKEDEVAEQIKVLKSEVTDYKQKEVDKSVKDNRSPFKGKAGDKTAVNARVEDYIKLKRGRENAGPLKRDDFPLIKQTEK